MQINTIIIFIISVVTLANIATVSAKEYDFIVIGDDSSESNSIINRLVENKDITVYIINRDADGEDTIKVYHMVILCLLTIQLFGICIYIDKKFFNYKTIDVSIDNSNDNIEFVEVITHRK